MQRRNLLAHIAVAGLLLCQLPWSHAQQGNAKPITVVVPFAPGGAIDAVARQLGQRMAVELGTPVVVENVTGAFGTIGTQRVARAPADGQTLLFAVSSPLNVAPLVNPSAVRYDTFKDFAPIATVGMLPFAVIARNGLQADSIEALVKLARAQPGKLNFGTDGTGSLLHLTGELINQRARIELVHVPYKAAPQALTDVAGGQLDLAVLPVALVQPLVKDGRVRALAVTASTRVAALSQVPTLSETSGFSGLAFESWMGLLAPAGTAPAVLARLTDATRRAVATDDWERLLEDRGVKPRWVGGPAFAELLASERRLIADVVAGSRIKPE